MQDHRGTRRMPRNLETASLNSLKRACPCLAGEGGQRKLP
jgi:hypothetical protein